MSVTILRTCSSSGPPASALGRICGARGESLAAAGQEARIVVCGATSGHSPPARLYRLWWKQLVIYGSTMGMPSDFEGAYELIRTGHARIHIDSMFPLAAAAEAHERLESGAQFGKVVLTIPD